MPHLFFVRPGGWCRQWIGYLLLVFFTIGIYWRVLLKSHFHWEHASNSTPPKVSMTSRSEGLEDGVFLFDFSVFHDGKLIKHQRKSTSLRHFTLSCQIHQKHVPRATGSSLKQSCFLWYFSGCILLTSLPSVFGKGLDASWETRIQSFTTWVPSWCGPW